MVSEKTIGKVGGKLLVKGFELAEDGSLLSATQSVGDYVDSIFDFSGLQRLRTKRKKIEAFDFAQIPALAMEEEKVFAEDSLTAMTDCNRQGTLIATCHYRGMEKIRIWSRDGEKLATWPHGVPIAQIAFHPRGDILAACDHKGSVCLWKLPDGDLLTKIVSKRPLTAVAFNSDGSWLVSANHRFLECWDASGNFLRKLRHGLDEVTKMRFNVNDTLLAVAGRIKSNRLAEGMIQLWDPRSLLPIANLEKFRLLVSDVLFDASGRQLYFSSRDNSLGVIHPYDGYTRSERVAHANRITSLALSQCGRILVSCGEKYVYFWRSRDLEMLGRISLDSAWDLQLLPDGKLLGRSDRGSTIWSFDWSTLQEKAAS